MKPRPSGRRERTALTILEARHLGRSVDARPGLRVLEGEILSLFGTSQDDGSWVGGTLRVEGRALSFIARGVPGLQVGRVVTLTGVVDRHPEYGVQLDVTSCRRSELPREAAALVRYLAANVDGLGVKLAARLVRALGVTDLLQRLQDDPSLAAKALPPKQGATVVQGLRAWRRDIEADRWCVELAPKLKATVGVTYTTARAIVRHFDAPEVADLIARRDPYRLLEVHGFGWKRADAVARLLGVAHDDDSRIEAAVLHVLDEAARGEGHTGLPPTDLTRRAAELAGVDEAIADAALERLEYYCFVSRDAGLVHEPGRLSQEWAIAGLVGLLLRRRYSFEARGAAVERIIERGRLNAEQGEAVRMALAHGISVLTGGPGTGKTYTMKTLIAAAAAIGLNVIVAAPTGKAASVVRHKTRHNDVGTVHRLIGGVPGNPRREGPITRGLLVLEESSMLDAEVAAWLMTNVEPGPGFRLLLVGDQNQLPAVGAGQVFADLIASGVVPVTRLVAVQRQKENSLIVDQAYRVLLGAQLAREETHDWTPVDLQADPVAAQNEVLRAVQRVIRQERETAAMLGESFDPTRQLQVLTPRRRGELGVEALNERLRLLMNPGLPAVGPYIFGGHRASLGDRVICVQNDYTVKPDGLMNGEQGVVESTKGNTIVLRLDDGRRVVTQGVQNLNVALAFAATVHRSQGSEYPVVVLVYHREHKPLYDSRLLYTGITRARRRLVLCADPLALRDTLAGGSSPVRWSGLADRIRRDYALRSERTA